VEGFVIPASKNLHRNGLMRCIKNAGVNVGVAPSACVPR
jgi:hypothetical protein